MRPKRVGIVKGGAGSAERLAVADLSRLRASRSQQWGGGPAEMEEGLGVQSLLLGWPRLWAAACEKAQSLEELPDPTVLSSMPPTPRGWALSLHVYLYLFFSSLPPPSLSFSLSLPFLTISVVSVPFSQSFCLLTLCFSLCV